MKRRFPAALTLALCMFAPAWCDAVTPEVGAERRVQSRILKTDSGERILEQSLEVEAPRSAVWKAYTTAAGWEAWAAPQAEVDLRVGGTVRTQYDKSAGIGDPGTNTLHIVNYVPEILLTLRAELQPNWPELLQRDADKLTNTILFLELEEGRTRIVSYGIGYGNDEEYEELLKFFVRANEGLMEGLRRYLEEGIPTEFP